MGAFHGLGKALRWLRAREDLKQHELSRAAGITKAMLSSYETERQRPSIETLEKILSGLGASLTDLNDALAEVNVRTAQRRSRMASPGRPQPDTSEMAKMFDDPKSLSADQQDAMRQMLAGFQSMMQSMAQQEAPQRAVPEPSAAPAAVSRPSRIGRSRNRSRG